MYSKRVIHKNIIDNNAYISAGDPYVGGVTDKSPWWAEMKNENFKPIRCQRSPENGERGNFHKKTYTTLGGCSEVIKYKAGGMVDDRLGKGFAFGSKDPSRRDEFFNPTRAEQYKAAIKRENYFSPLPGLARTL